jgi:hypothetical protein
MVKRVACALAIAIAAMFSVGSFAAEGDFSAAPCLLAFLDKGEFR